MKKLLYSKSRGLALNGFTIKSGLFVLAVLFCFGNNLLAGIKPSPGFSKNYFNSSGAIASPIITAGAVTGSISACPGMVSTLPNIHYFPAFTNYQPPII